MSNYTKKQSKYEMFQTEKEKVRFRIEQFKRNLKFGYSDSNFSTMAYDFSKLSPHMAPNDLEQLGTLWSRSYSETLSSHLIDDTIDDIINQI